MQIPSSDDEQFKEGQKLEAVDPLEMSRICPATVAKVSSFYSNYWIINSDVQDHDAD
jgi:hypothetical protein